MDLPGNIVFGVVYCENTNYKLLLHSSDGDMKFSVESSVQTDVNRLLGRTLVLQTPKDNDISCASLHLGKRLYPGCSQEIFSILYFYDDIILIMHLILLTWNFISYISESHRVHRSSKKQAYKFWSLTCAVSFYFILMWWNQYMFQPIYRASEQLHVAVIMVGNEIA